MDKRGLRIAGIGAVVLLGAGLSGALTGCQASLARDEATRIISAHSFFQETKYFDVPITVEKKTFSCVQYGDDKPGWLQMIDMQYATAHESSSNQCELQLTDAGQSASAQWKTEDGVWKVPIAAKTFLKIEKIDYGLGEFTEVKFTWRWLPTPFGQRLPSNSAGLQKGVAQCGHTLKGWQVKSIQ
jgi:hypothetical protein